MFAVRFISERQADRCVAMPPLRKTTGKASTAIASRYVETGTQNMWTIISTMMTVVGTAANHSRCHACAR